MSSKLSISRDLSPTTRTLLALIKTHPVLVIKRDSGSNRCERVFKELRAMSGEGFQVFENENGISVVRDGATRSFLI
jgi:hypothetical protein